MANSEHLEILKQGVETWNRWRQNHPRTETQLDGADLRRLNLPAINLSDVNLNRAFLSGANLRDADLSYARLIEADLSSANLDRANLSRTFLYGADLSNAVLKRVNFRGSLLDMANFARARVRSTIFVNVDLSQVRGLDTVRHEGPSSIGIDTILLSSGSVSRSFLRGAGLPDAFIEYLASLRSGAIQFYSCFISYSSKDEAFAQRLHADLQQQGVRCWFSPEDLKIGDKIRSTIDQSIRVHDKLLVILSENSMQSDWVEDEVETAIEEEQRREEAVLFPIRLDGTVMDTDQAWAAKLRRTRHIGDFTRWQDHDAYQRGLDRLLRDLKAENKG